MCPVEYRRYCSRLLHFPPYYLGNNSWWGGYFLRVIWRKWGPCRRPIIQRRMHGQEVRSTLSPCAGPIHATASQQVAAWFGVFRCKKYIRPTFVFSSVQYFSGARVTGDSGDMEGAAPLPKGNFALWSQWIVGCQAAKGEIYNRQYMQYTIDKIDRYTINVWLQSCIRYWLLCRTEGKASQAARAALCIWKISALYKDKFSGSTTDSEPLLWATSCHP